ncbi:hypothetical protein CC2G_002713 [Coprinopsis cinerea AmutBmut pab1-1]|nr:hypothetical protein CC2G_002713 [Coprinopsis cinerea AmutBmut pab1-1]
MAVAPTTRPKKAARGPSRNTSLTKSGARHKGRRPTGKEPRPRPERPVYRDTVERIKWFTARAEILAILTPTEARCKICDRTLQLERPKKTVKNNTQGGYYHHNARKHLLTKTHQRKMEVWQERKRLELAAAERIRVRMSLAHLCGPSPSYSPIEHSAAAILVQMNQLSLTGFQTLPNGSTTNEQHNSNQHI